MYKGVRFFFMTLLKKIIFESTSKTTKNGQKKVIFFYFFYVFEVISNAKIAFFLKKKAIFFGISAFNWIFYAGTLAGNLNLSPVF